MFRGFFGRFVRHLPQGLHKRQRYEKHACSFAAKQQRFDHQHNGSSPHSRRAGDLNRRGKPPKRRRWRMQRGGFEEAPRLARRIRRGNRLGATVGSSGVLPSLPPRAKKVAPQSEILLGPMVDTSSFGDFSGGAEKSLGPVAENTHSFAPERETISFSALANNRHCIEQKDGTGIADPVLFVHFLSSDPWTPAERASRSCCRRRSDSSRRGRELRDRPAAA